MFTSVVALIGAVAGVGVADTSPGGHDAAPWPVEWTAYTWADGSPVTDPAGDSSPEYTDLVTGPAGDEATLQTAYDGTNLFFRLRLGGDPVRTPTDYFSAGWLVGLGVNGVFQGAVGFDGKPPGSGTEYVYVVNADGSLVTRVYADPFTNGPTNDSRGVRATERDAAGNWFMDFQVPVDTVYAGSGVQPGDVLQFFAGTATARDVSAVNKDWMTGLQVDFTDLEERPIAAATLELAASAVVVSGPEPPVVGAETRLDLVLEAGNTGFNTLTSLAVVDALGPLVVIESVSESSGGSITHDGSSVRWLPADLPPGGQASAVISVSITPDLGDVGQLISIDQGASGAGSDALTGASTTAATAPVVVGPVEAVSGVSLAKAVTGVEPAIAGDGLERTFVVTASNPGPSALSEVAIIDQVDDGLSVTSTNCASLGGTDLTLGNAVRCEDLLLGPGSSIDLVITFEVPATTDATTIENTATMTASQLADVITSTSVAVQVDESVGLSLTKSFSSPSLPAGSTGSSAVITVSNSGPSSADGVRVTDLIDPKLVVTGASVGGGSCTDADRDPATIECEIETLAPGASADLTVTFDLAVTALPGTLIENVAEATSDEMTGVILSPVASLEVAARPPLPPIADNDVADTAVDTGVTIVVLANDGDPQGDALAVAIVSAPGRGTVIVNAAGTLTYTPDRGFIGQDSFVYEACEADSPSPLCDDATVIVTVTAVDRPPALMQGGTTIEWIAFGATPAPLPFVDPEGESIVAEVVDGALPPGVELLEDGTFRGEATEIGAFVFSVLVCDPADNCSVFVYAVVVE